MERSKIELQDLLDEIDVSAQKALTLIYNLQNEYEVYEKVQPSIQWLKTDCLNSNNQTAINTFEYLRGYNEIMTYISIVCDYVYCISVKAKYSNSAH